MTRKELVKVIKRQMDESGIEDESFLDDLADRLDNEFGLIDEEDDEDEEER